MRVMRLHRGTVIVYGSCHLIESRNVVDTIIHFVP